MTAQVPNRIFAYGAFRSLLTRPELKFFEQLQPKQAFCALTTANWSGYTTSWEIREGKLYLTGLEGTVCKRAPDDEVESTSRCAIGHRGACDLASVTLPEICDVPSGGIYANWFSGELRIPEGELVTYVHAGWASEFERDLILQVERGIVMSEKIVRLKDESSSGLKPSWIRLFRALKGQ